MGRNLLENFKVSLVYPDWVLPSFVFVEQIWYYKAMYQYSIAQKIRCWLLMFTFATRDLLLVFHVQRKRDFKSTF